MNAKEYRKLKNQQTKIFDVVTSSGMVFKCSKPDLQIYYASGKLPDFVKNQMQIAKLQNNDLNETALAEKIAKDETLQEKVLHNALFARDLILRHVHEPKLVENPMSDDELGFDELLASDFEELTKWLLSGGEAHAEKFRAG